MFGERLDGVLQTPLPQLLCQLVVDDSQRFILEIKRLP